ncbi:biotin--[acetyl-CoA-carboxylase] ligase [Desulfopila inferna]|uniref:biotin--[acetyl-CoA-carboxylase] ligase n=1 Tax=Desulfopila inferna TaxID=468528 RepID=UPI0019669067|nr:biotin--[acetyl-CoA-carboxylase] ligase [Desulfopila inferna]MBM9606235.1 biotin--[acetyl-CoA-carboxylase] ligase [Desulfopila inferna]
MNPKDKIYNLLRDADDVLSGERISEELGTSRVSVWKHIQGMVKSGIPIVSSPKGYLLSSDPDSLNPLEFGDRKDQIHHFGEILSTMNEAIKLAQQGCPEFTVVVAERQTQGRGRMERVWASADGGLYFTLVLRPIVPVMLAGLVNLAAAVEMAALLGSYGITASLKWPNDILVGTHKICGFLSQMESEGDLLRHLNIGIGLNVNNDPKKEEPSAVSLRELLGRQVPRREILINFLNRFEKRLENFDAATVIEDWKAGNSTIGQHVRISTLRTTVEGVAMDINGDGALILQMDDGSHQTVVHGDCFYQ